MAEVRDVAVIVGSLRKDSLNRKVAMALAELAPPSLKLSEVPIGQLPLYSQDDDANPRRPIKTGRSRRWCARMAACRIPTSWRACCLRLHNGMHYARFRTKR